MYRRSWFKFAVFVPVGVLLLGVVASLFIPRPYPTKWTPDLLHQTLTSKGDSWQAQPWRGGLLLKRPNDPISWQDLGEAAERHSTVFGGTPNRLFITIPFGQPPRNFTPEELVLDGIVIRGHPDTLTKISAYLD